MSEDSPRNTDRRPRAVVIGAGISGLACAYRLRERGVDVQVLEAAPRVGGAIQSFVQDGYLLELGPNTYTRRPATERLIADLGIGDEHLTSLMRDQPRYIYDSGRLQRVPLGPGELLATRLLSFSGKLRLLREPFITKRPPEEQSVADFVSEHVGREVLEMFVGPFVSGVYAGDPGRMSMPAAFPLIYDFARRRGSVVRGALAYFSERRRERLKTGRPRARRQPSALCSFRKGLAQLPERLAEALGSRVHCGLSVVRIEAREGRWLVHVHDRGAPVVFPAEALIIATPAHAAASLLRDVAPTAAQALAEVEYTPVMVAHVGAPLASLRVKPQGFGFLVPRHRDVRALGVLWTSAIFDQRAPEDHALLTVFYGGMTDPKMPDLDDREVERALLRDLSASMGWDGTRTLLRITRLPKALPAYTLGHLRRVDAWEETTRRLPAPLRLIGNFISGISLPDCVRRGEECAVAIARQLEAQP
ncbi:protoporphyrinogen oxidase [bacterium]|nr:protoporphyrinogen oxidase [bacterium]